MMHFFHQYLLHVTFEVLEPLWLTLQKGVQSATSLDEVRPVLSSLLKISLNAENGNLYLKLLGLWLPVLMMTISGRAKIRMALNVVFL